MSRRALPSHTTGLSDTTNYTSICICCQRVKPVLDFLDTRAEPRHDAVPHLTLQDSEAVASAVASFRRRPALGFSDCLVLEVARKAGHLPLGTFDRAFSKLAGVERL